MSKEPGKWSITPGVGLMTKQLSDDQVDQLENVLKTLDNIRTKNETVYTVVGCGADRDKMEILTTGK